MSQVNVELVRRGVDARDVEALVGLCSPRFEMHATGVVGEPVHYRGADGIRQYFLDVAEHWAAFDFQIEQIHDRGDQVLVIGRRTARGRASGVDVASREAFVVALEQGRITSLRSFRDPEQALDAVGLAE